MKLMIASDIHGSAYFCRRLAEQFEAERADKLLLLGDILYHGPRNELPREYAPKLVIEILGSINEKILCVRGNCDTEVDQMVLNFPVLADYAALLLDGRVFYATHGHKYNIDSPLPMAEGDILLYGHTHVPMCEQRDGRIFANCGSVSIPKENSAHSYMVIENGKMLWKDLGGNIYKEYEL
ncbi:MAG: phosphodiesterase [Clostridia bacterium]|nr:phosphodiesterase [Clostridia bacterium]